LHLHKSAQRQVHNYLRATNLEVGLLPHFEPEPFFRLYVPNRNESVPDAHTKAQEVLTDQN